MVILREFPLARPPHACPGPRSLRSGGHPAGTRHRGSGFPAAGFPGIDFCPPSDPVLAFRAPSAQTGDRSHRTGKEPELARDLPEVTKAAQKHVLHRPSPSTLARGCGPGGRPAATAKVTEGALRKTRFQTCELLTFKEPACYGSGADPRVSPGTCRTGRDSATRCDRGRSISHSAQHLFAGPHPALLGGLLSQALELQRGSHRASGPATLLFWGRGATRSHFITKLPLMRINVKT